MAASGTGKSAGQRALTQRRRNRTLPAIEVPRVKDQDLTRALGNIAEHLRIYEGDVAAPKERFITLQELEDTGLIESQTKGGYAYISRILSKDVAQKSGSTANPTLKGTVRKDTALGPRTAGGGGGGSQNPIEQGKRGLIQKLSDIENVVVQSPAQADFLYYDGGKWKNFSLFKRNNKWTGRNTFVGATTFSGGIDTTTLAIDGVDIATYIPTVTDDLYVDVTGDTMTGILGLTYSATAGARNSTMVLYSGNPQLSIEDTGAAADEGVWNIIGGLTSLKIRALSDDYATAVDVLSFNRGTGATVSDVTLSNKLIIDAEDDALTLKSDQVSGNTATPWLQYDDSAGTSMGFVGFGSNSNTDFYIWNEAGGDIRFNTDLYVGDGANSLTIETSSGDAVIYLKADTDNNTETDNPYIRMEQDGNAVDYIVGLSGATAVDAEGNAFSAGLNNYVTHHTQYSSGGFQWGINGTRLMALDTTDLTLTLPATGALEVNGSSYKTNPSGPRFGQYTSTIGYVQAPAGGAIAMWADSTAQIISFNDDLTTTFGATGNGFNGSITGQYGSVQTTGTTGGYGGISLAGNFVLMNSGSAHVGLYNDINNEWIFLAYPNSYINLYYNGVDELRTQDSNAAGESTGVMIKHHNQSYYDAGLNQMPRMRTNVSFTLTDQDCGGYMYHSNSTVYTITLNNTGGGGADFPIGGTFFILNYGTGNVTVNTGSGTLYSPQLGTSTTGSRTIGGNSVATILKYGADSWFVWGDAIS